MWQGQTDGIIIERFTETIADEWGMLTYICTHNMQNTKTKYSQCWFQHWFKAIINKTIFNVPFLITLVYVHDICSCLNTTQNFITKINKQHNENVNSSPLFPMKDIHNTKHFLGKLNSKFCIEKCDKIRYKLYNTKYSYVSLTCLCNANFNFKKMKH